MVDNKIHSTILLDFIIYENNYYLEVTFLHRKKYGDLVGYHPSYEYSILIRKINTWT
jgi:hypothetical protein